MDHEPTAAAPQTPARLLHNVPRPAGLPKCENRSRKDRGQVQHHRQPSTAACFL